MKKTTLVLLLLSLIFVWAPVFAVTDYERIKLEQQLSEIEKQMTIYESTIDDYRKQGKNLRNEIKKFDAEVGKLNLQIKAINLSLTQLDEEINKNKDKIKTNEEELRFKKNALASALQAIYDQESQTLIEIMLANVTISRFFDSLNNLLGIQDNLRESVEQLEEVRDNLLEEKEQLALKKTDAANLKTYRDSQKKSLLTKKNEKDALLKVTKGQEEKYQELLKETKKTAAQIRSRIFEFLGGGELTFEKAYQLAEHAGDAVGVEPALILAVLDKESALGQNVGRCGYRTAMHPVRDIPIFLEIVTKLGLSPDSMPVSCANKDGAFGGAMGPAQFIPSTWKLYRSRVEELTGNKPASPWRNTDAFIATAIYLRDSGAYAGSSIEDMRRAAARYYAGSRWRRYLWTYGERVIARVLQFREDIAALSG